MEAVDIETLNRIQVEYMEMPDLKLTVAQAARLWSLPRDVGESALQVLLERGFLVLARDGGFRRPGR
jgi:hypothetical protein